MSVIINILIAISYLLIAFMTVPVLTVPVPGKPDAQMLLIAAFLMTGGQGIDALGPIITGALNKK